MVFSVGHNHVAKEDQSEISYTHPRDQEMEDWSKKPSFAVSDGFQAAPSQSKSPATTLLGVGSADALYYPLAKNDEKTPRGVTGAVTEILWAASLIIISMAVLSALLLAIIYRNLIDTSASPHEAFPNATFLGDHSDFIWVDYSATRLVTIASWTSTAAPLLAGSVMTILAYPLARSLWENSGKGKVENLPTPYQLTLVIAMATASPSSIFRWFQYLFWRRPKGLFGGPKKRNSQVGVVKGAVAGLLVTMLLSTAILAVDTWFHVTTTTLPFTSFTLVPQPASQYSRGFSPECLSFDPDTPSVTMTGKACNVNQGGQSVFLVNAPEAFTTLASTSTTNVAEIGFVNGTQDSNGTSFAFLRPAFIPTNTDFRASTLAVSTQCRPMSQRCDLRSPAGAATPFNCTPALYGDLSAGTWVNGRVENYMSFGMIMFKDAGLTDNSTKVYGSNGTNPFYFGTGAKVPYENSDSDAELVKPMHGGAAFLLNCSISVYELEYSYTNGSFGDWKFELANTTTAGTIEAPLIASQPRPAFVTPFLQNALFTAALNRTADELAEVYAMDVSRSTLSQSAGVMTPRGTLLEQTWETRLAARLQKGPLYALVALDFLFVLLGFVFAAWALLARGEGIDDVQVRLSMAGLAATAFEGKHAERPVESVRDLFAERYGSSGKVGLTKSREGGWRYSAF